MMGYDNLALGFAGIDRILDELETTLVLSVEIGTSQHVLSIENPMKVGNTTLIEKGISWINMSPKG